MKNQEVSVVNIYKQAWKYFKEVPQKLILLAVVYLIIAIIPNIATELVGDNVSQLFVINIVGMFISGILTLGLIDISFKVIKNKDFNITNLFNRTDLISKYIFAYSLYMIAVFFGVVMLIIPGIIFSIRFSQWMYLVVDKKDISAIESLKMSWRITKGHTLDLIVFALFTIIIVFVGIIFTLGLGTIVLIPVSIIASNLFYQELINDYNRKQICNSVIEEVKVLD